MYIWSNSVTIYVIIPFSKQKRFSSWRWVECSTTCEFFCLPNFLCNSSHLTCSAWNWILRPCTPSRISTIHILFYKSCYDDLPRLGNRNTCSFRTVFGLGYGYCPQWLRSPTPVRSPTSLPLLGGDDGVGPCQRVFILGSLIPLTRQ